MGKGFLGMLFASALSAIKPASQVFPMGKRLPNDGVIIAAPDARDADQCVAQPNVPWCVVAHGKGQL